MKREDVVKFFYEQKIRVLPLIKDKKIPATKNGVHDAKVSKVVAYGNFGIACGSGFTIVDIDPRNNGIGTVANWKKAGFTLPDTVTVRTASGGWHHYYKGVVKNTKLEGVDVLSDGKYAVAPTSIVNGVEYVFENSPEDTELAELPMWLIEMCKRDESLRTKRFENETADLTDLENILFYFDPSCGYEDWYKVGMGIHHTNSGKEGFLLWLKWSRGDLCGKRVDKFTDTESSLFKKWQSFDSSGGITAGSIFYMAKDKVDDDLFKDVKSKEEGQLHATYPPPPLPPRVLIPIKQVPEPKHGILAMLYNEFMGKAYEPIPIFALGASLSVLSAITQSPYLISGSIRTRSYNLLLGAAGIGKNDYLEISKSILREVSQRGGNVQLLGEEIRSGQALKGMLSDYPTRMLFIDEWTDTLERAYAFKRDAVAYEITTILKTLWGDVRELEGSRKRDKQESIKNIIEPRISLLATGVPSKFLDLMENNAFISDGLMSRIEVWYCNEIKPFKNRRDFRSYTPNDDLIKILTALFVEAMDDGCNVEEGCKILQKPRSRRVEIVSGAHDLIDKEIERINNERHDNNERSIIGRLLERMKTYAGLHAIGRNSLHVTELDVEEFAIPLFRYQYEQTMSIVSKQRESSHTKEVNLILKHIPRDKFISARDLYHRSTTFRKISNKMQERVAYLSFLSQQGFIELKENGESRLLTTPSL